MPGSALPGGSPSHEKLGGNPPQAAIPLPTHSSQILQFALASEADIAATDAEAFGYGSCDALWPMGWRQAFSRDFSGGQARLRQCPYETFSFEADWGRAATFVRRFLIPVFMRIR